ncbi:MAG TPA: alpha/beta fold hydrolase [Flavobacterium sp.]|nr:alpha/beta fold hydrolase [Flavobacterium sp.]
MNKQKELIYAKVEGTGKPMLIIHGFLGMSDNWKTLGNRYAETGFEVHLLDMRNHGRSFHSSEFHYEAMAQDVIDYCEENNLESIVLIGHSMGGKIAMKVAVKQPSLIEKLIIADISPRRYAPHHQDILAALNAVDFSTNPSRAEVQKTIEFYISEPGVIQFLMKNVYRVTPKQLGFRFNLEAFNQSQEAIGEALAADEIYPKTTLFIRGEKSGYIQPKDEELIKKHFPNSKTETISGAGHWLHADKPIDFYEKTMTFLQ